MTIKHLTSQPSTIAWVPKSDAQRYYEKKVDCVHACALSREPLNPGASDDAEASLTTNHWVLFLRLADSGFIRLDPSPGADRSLTLICSKKDSLHREESAKVLHMAASGLTVKVFLELLQSSKYDRYRFSEAGTGCRNWDQNVLKLLRDHQYLTSSEEVQEALDALCYVWTENGEKAPESEQSGITIGAFYDL